MKQFWAIFFIVVAAIYGDFSADNPLYSLLIPLAALGGLLYLFWFQGFIAIAAGYTTIHFFDLGSTSLFKALMPPLLLLASIIYLFWWLHANGIISSDSVFGGGDSTGGEGGGDCGGGGDGGC
ncbi:hypothetical protein BOW53_14280 [Solemya pervernicosa gill symbiont]|uniref:Uncharacterized protein n=2 Tax=Gammaproteobacteria incertae sedis TaxID=118884 RepID=A0A1T2L160_9GAMM|nr:hypothetical protein [Candidatus Reidiella endopervernicosa]OOZ38760.1 hypothetical protein BOW53_14280 [Solemya pervernicosa gill symbiont]QKQ26367.1 hypothetical protein HUE57_08810 [Candidatus Reidiella endopervernicosa]